jgi:hypothetical protein
MMKVTKEILIDLADNLDFGFRCFIHKKNHEVVTFMDEDEFSDLDTWEEDIDKILSDRDNYIKVEKMEFSDGFEIMEDFLKFVDDNIIKDRLHQALEGRKPFSNFNIQIDSSGEYREKWFAYKRERMIDWVKGQLERELD